MKKILLSIFTILILSSYCFTQTVTKTTRLAGEQLSKGNLSEALKILDEAISKKQDLLEALKMRSYIKSISGNTPGAIADMSEAIKLNPTDPELFGRRGNLKVFINDPTALMDFDKAIANGYNTDKTFIGRAMAYRNQGILEKSEADYRTAYGLDSGSARAVLGLSSLLEQTKRNDEAISILQNFIHSYEQKENKKTPKVSANPVPSQSVEVLKDTEEETQILTTGASVNIDDAQNMSIDEVENYLNTAAVYANLADLLLKKGDVEGALDNAQKAIDMKSSSPYALGVRGKAYMEKKEFEKALQDFDKSIVLMPKLNNNYIDRGIIYLILGDKEKAQADFDTFLKINTRGKTYLERRIKEAKEKFSFD